MNDKELVARFGSDIKIASSTEGKIFGRLAGIINVLGLDWWKIDEKGEIARFGSKSTLVNIAEYGLGRVFVVRDSLRISINAGRSKGSIPGMTTIINKPLTNDLVDIIEADLTASISKWPKRLTRKASGNGFWPNADGEKQPCKLNISKKVDANLVDPSITPNALKILNEIQNDKTLDDTQKRMEIEARVGHGKFRRDVIKRAGGKCEITALANEQLLIASHIHAWANCATGSQRLDCNNGLLLSPSLDKLFDKGIISFDNEGYMLVQPSNLGVLKMLVPQVLKKLNKLTKKPNIKQCFYLDLHRKAYSFNGAGMNLLRVG